MGVITRRILTFDPGRTTGWARFVDGVLTEAGTIRPRERGVPAALAAPEVPTLADLVLIEQPRWYPQEREVDANDLLDLSVLVGELKGYFEGMNYFGDGGPQTKVELVYPRTWKGSVPKDIHNRRVLKALSEEELAVLPKRPRAKTPDPNCTDAVGIGLWKLGRMS